MLAWGADSADYLRILPGLLLYGIGLALVLTVNDPVSLDSIPDAQQGQASGVSATAEQCGGALGIAVLYSIFHAAYVSRLNERVDAGSLPDLTPNSGAALKGTLDAAEASGLKFGSIDPALRDYILFARDASNTGFSVTFITIAVLAAIACGLMAWLVRKPREPAA